MRRNIPYAVLFPVIGAGLAIILMLWAISGSHVGPDPSKTTGTAIPRTTDVPVPAPTAPANDAGSDSARGRAPLNRSR
jgi:hypothetical protein